MLEQLLCPQASSRKHTVRPEFRDRMHVADINAKPAARQYDPLPPPAGSRPTVRILQRTRGPKDLSLHTADVGAYPQRTKESGPPPRRDVFVRNPADAGDIEGAQPRLMLPLQERHAKKIAQAEARATAAREGRMAAEKITLTRAAADSVLAALRARDRDSCGIVTAHEVRKTLRAAGVDDSAAEAALPGFMDNVGNVRYTELHSVLDAHAVTPPAPAVHIGPAGGAGGSAGVAGTAHEGQSSGDGAANNTVGTGGNAEDSGVQVRQDGDRSAPGSGTKEGNGTEQSERAGKERGEGHGGE